jgi:hypothetical protein
VTNTNRYNIDYNKLILARIPVELRSPEVIAWVTLLCMPFAYLYTVLISFRQAKLYQLSITPQVCYLEKMLNDRYDFLLRRIYIIDGALFDPTYEFLKVENKPNFIYTKAEISAGQPASYDYLKGEIGAFTFDFIVKVPTSLTFNQDEMKGLINTYKLASKIYTIQTF